MSSNIVTVDFRNDTLFAVERDDGVYVAVKPISEKIGLAWQSQLQRLKDDPILSEGITTIVIPSPSGAQEMTCLRLELMNGWLFKIDSRRVKDDEVRQRVLEYQRDCYRVLFEHFHGQSNGVQPGPNFEVREAEKHSLSKIKEVRHIFGARAAGRLWFALGLDLVPEMFIDDRQMSFFANRGLRTVADNDPVSREAV